MVIVTHAPSEPKIIQYFAAFLSRGALPEEDMEPPLRKFFYSLQ